MSQMYVTEQDEENEIEILDSIKHVFKDFKGVNFRQQKGAYNYDFAGFFEGVLIMIVEVRVRDISSERYLHYFFSKYKHDYMKKYPDIAFYWLAYFPKERLVKIFDLRDIDLEKRTITIFHKRAKEKMVKDVYLIPRRQFAAEYYLF